MNLTLIGSLLAALLTIMVFSYLLGNNPLYRLALHIFVGVSVGYATLLLLGNVLVPQLFDATRDVGSVSWWLLALPILLGLLLLLRLFRGSAPGRGSGLGGALVTIVLNIALSTGAALAVGGALSGTLVPQVADTMRSIPANPAGSLIIVLGVVASLYYFQFTVGPSGARSSGGALVAGAGRWLIVIALGATLGSLAVSFAGALVDRVAFLFSLKLF